MNTTLQDEALEQARKPKIHTLKTWPEYFAAIIDGRKRFELRKNDRDYQVGDLLVLQEYDPITRTFTKEMIAKRVTYMIVGGPFLPEDMACMSLEDYPVCAAELRAAADALEGR